MASNNEAKIKFTADVSDFNNSIKEAKDETKQLNAEMRLNEATFKNTGDAAEYLANKHDLLEQKLAANQKQQDALNEKIEAATEYFGEDSAEVQKLESQLTNAEIAEQKLLTQINSVNDQIQDQQDAADKDTSALDELTETISKQESELSDLKSQYASAVIEFGETSDEAQTLAGEITELSGELDENRSTLENAYEQAESLSSGYSDLSGESENALSALDELTATIADQETELELLKDEYTNAVLEFGSTSDEAQALAGEISSLSSELAENKSTLEEARAGADEYDNSLGGIESAAGSLPGPLGQVAGGVMDIANSFISGGIVGLMSELVDKAFELAQAAWDMANEWQEAEGSIAVGTGLVGDELDNLTEKAYEAAGALADVNFDGKTSADVIAELNTRLGLTGDEAEAVTAEIAKFAKANGEDAVPAVDTLVNLMHRYGLETSDLPELLDKLTIAQQATQYSASDMADAVEKNAPSFKALGMDMDEALSYMMAFADYSDTTYSSAMAGTKKAVTALSDATDDVPGAFNEAIAVMQSGADMSTILSTEIGDTGKTISAVFGKKSAQDMVDFFSNSQTGVNDYIGSLHDCDGAMQTTYENTVTWKDENAQVFNAIKGQVFSAVFGSDGIVNSLDSADQGVQTANSNMSMSFVDFGNTAKTTASDAAKDVSTSFADMDTSTTSSVEDMKQQVNAKNEALRADMSTFATNASTDMVTKFDTMRQQTSDKFENLRAKVQDRAGVFKENLSTFGTNVKDTIQNSFENMKSQASTKFDNMKATVGTTANSLYSALSTFGANSRNAISNAFDAMRNTAGNIFSNMHSNLSGWMSRIRGLFDFSWSLPRPKLPHINWHWNDIGGILRLPVFDGISWYAKGGIFDSPTIAGIGEAGPEAVVPLDKLWSKIDNLTEAAYRETDSINYDLLADKIAGAIAGMSMTVDGTALVGAIAGPMDSALGKIQNQRGRGR